MPWYILVTLVCFSNVYTADTVTFKNLNSDECFTVPHQCISTAPIYTTWFDLAKEKPQSSEVRIEDETFTSLKNFFRLSHPAHITYHIKKIPVPDLQPALEYLQYDEFDTRNQLLASCAKNYLSLESPPAISEYFRNYSAV